MCRHSLCQKNDLSRISSFWMRRKAPRASRFISRLWI